MKTYVAYQGDIEYVGVVYAGNDLEIAKSKQEDDNLEFWIDVWVDGKVIGRFVYDEESKVYEYSEIDL